MRMQKSAERSDLCHSNWPVVETLWSRESDGDLRRDQMKIWVAKKTVKVLADFLKIVPKIDSSVINNFFYRLANLFAPLNLTYCIHIRTLKNTSHVSINARL